MERYEGSIVPEPGQEAPSWTALGNELRRTQMFGKSESCHPDTIRRVVAELDRQGLSEAGDVIRSLVHQIAVEEIGEMKKEEIFRKITQVLDATD